MIDAVLLVLFPVLMIFAAFSDLFTMTIPNRIAILLVVGFLALSLTLHVPAITIGTHVLAGLAMLAVTFGMFAVGWFGGGDAKLAAATVLWLGVGERPRLCAGLDDRGGALTLLILAARKWPLPSPLLAQDWIARLHDKSSGVPYGIALAGAGLFLFPQTQIWMAAA